MAGGSGKEEEVDRWHTALAGSRRYPGCHMRHSRRELFVHCRGRIMQSTIVNCSCDGMGGGFGTYTSSSLLVVDSVRASASGFSGAYQQ